MAGRVRFLQQVQRSKSAKTRHAIVGNHLSHSDWLNAVVTAVAVSVRLNATRTRHAAASDQQLCVHL
jgi:hypothetical protein